MSNEQKFRCQVIALLFLLVGSVLWVGHMMVAASLMPENLNAGVDLQTLSFKSYYNSSAFNVIRAFRILLFLMGVGLYSYSLFSKRPKQHQGANQPAL